MVKYLFMMLFLNKDYSGNSQLATLSLLKTALRVFYTMHSSYYFPKFFSFSRINTVKLNSIDKI